MKCSFFPLQSRAGPNSATASSLGVVDKPQDTVHFGQKCGVGRTRKLQISCQPKAPSIQACLDSFVPLPLYNALETSLKHRRYLYKAAPRQNCAGASTLGFEPPKEIRKRTAQLRFDRYCFFYAYSRIIKHDINIVIGTSAIFPLRNPHKFRRYQHSQQSDSCNASMIVSSCRHSRFCKQFWSLVPSLASLLMAQASYFKVQPPSMGTIAPASN